MAEPEIYWEGKSGKKYGYWIRQIDTIFKDEPGNYIYAGETRVGYWRPFYIGQTNSLNQRLANHEKEACAIKNGATHIHAHTSSSSEQVRKAEESDLIARWNPDCNKQPH